MKAVKVCLVTALVLLLIKQAVYSFPADRLSLQENELVANNEADTDTPDSAPEEKAEKSEDEDLDKRNKIAKEGSGGSPDAKKKTTVVKTTSEKPKKEAVAKKEDVSKTQANNVDTPESDEADTPGSGEDSEDSPKTDADATTPTENDAESSGATTDNEDTKASINSDKGEESKEESAEEGDSKSDETETKSKQTPEVRKDDTKATKEDRIEESEDANEVEDSEGEEKILYDPAPAAYVAEEGQEEYSVKKESVPEAAVQKSSKAQKRYGGGGGGGGCGCGCGGECCGCENCCGEHCHEGCCEQGNEAGHHSGHEHGHHGHGECCHHHGHHHGFCHEWGEECCGEQCCHECCGGHEGGHHHGHEHDHCCEGHQGCCQEGSNCCHECCNQEHHEPCGCSCCGGGGGGGGGYGWGRSTVPLGYHCHDMVSKSGKDKTKRYCVPVYAYPEVSAQRDNIERPVVRKQTVHVGYGYASGDNYRLGYQEGGMGGLASTFTGGQVGADHGGNFDAMDHFNKRSYYPHHANIVKRHFEGSHNYAAMNSGMMHGSATPYGHPVTHPGFTTMGFPGHALASQDVRNMINHPKSKRQVQHQDDYQKRQFYGQELMQQQPGHGMFQPGGMGGGMEEGGPPQMEQAPASFPGGMMPQDNMQMGSLNPEEMGGAMKSMLPRFQSQQSNYPQMSGGDNYNPGYRN